MTPHDTTTRQLSVNYGVTPVLAPDVSSTDEMLAHMDRVMVEGGYLQAGATRGVSGRPARRPARHDEPDEASSRGSGVAMLRGIRITVLLRGVLRVCPAKTVKPDDIP